MWWSEEDAGLVCSREPETVPGEAAARAGHVQHTPPLHMAHASDSETVVSGKSHLRSGGRGTEEHKDSFCKGKQMTQIDNV